MFSKISEELRNFIRTNVNSVSLLEVLFLLKKDPSHRWTSGDVSLEMRTNPSYALAQLLNLLAADIAKDEVTGDGNQQIHHFYFNTMSPHLEMIEQLEKLYTERKATLINFIYSQPIDNIRSFADAFIIKKDES